MAVKTPGVQGSFPAKPGHNKMPECGKNVAQSGEAKREIPVSCSTLFYFCKALPRANHVFLLFDSTLLPFNLSPLPLSK
jgi:hypothetical protein